MTTPRITVPTLFDERWDSVLICTYGADLAFYERDLWRQLDRARNRIIFADARQVARKLSDAETRERLRQVNRTYVLAPVQAAHAAHAKLILLLREDRGLLAVGSGNLGMDGYASQGECFTLYRWSEDNPGPLSAFIAAMEFLTGILDRGLVDDVVRSRVQQAWQDAPWIYRPPAPGPRPVRHNLDRPLLDQFIEAIAGRQIQELVIHAPFYDHQCRALSELIKKAEPSQLQVLLQERITSVDPQKIGKVLASAGCPVDVRSVQAEEPGTFLHAKFLIARCGDAAVCLQGSPNLSAHALMEPFPAGNIELANLLTGQRSEFDHLVHNLAVSPEPVEVARLGLALAKNDDASQDTTPGLSVRELAWVPPRLTGVFGRDVTDPPALRIGEETVGDVIWELHEAAGGATHFTAILGSHASGLLSRVEAVTFVFATGEPSAPVYPYHLNTLIALASGQGRTDLLKQAGDFDLGDEELEQLLAQLDEVLVVDGHSIWKMLKRKARESADDGEPSSLSYDDLDWDAIQSHPKLAQYRNWRHGTTDPTGLGIILHSIAERFRAEVKQRRSAGPAADGTTHPADLLDDLSATIAAEDEEAAEAEQLATDRRRLSARTRAKRQFQNFVKRFVNGIADEEFVQLAGPSVLVPSYVVFNHLCWKLIQADLADPLQIISAQSALWRFFWGEPSQPGYLASMSTGEQEAALDILDRHHAEPVLLCSLFQAYDIARSEGTDRDVAELRDAWRGILDHPLWQPTTAAVLDAATVLAPACKTASELVHYLGGLASFVQAGEPLQIIERVIGARSGSVTTTKPRVRRAGLGEQRVTAYEVLDPAAGLTPQTAEVVLREMRALLHEPERDYIRIEHPDAKIIVFADYITGDYVCADRNSGVITELECPEAPDPAWRQGLAALRQLAG